MARGSRIALGAMAIALLAPVPAAVADGPVVPNLTFGGSGVTDAGGSVRYVALPGAAGSTMVVKIDAAAGSVLVQRVVPGRWGVTMVSADGVTDGLSGDGRTLILAEFPRSDGPRRAYTRFLVLGTERLSPRATVRVPGWDGLDAVSADGRLLYLIQAKPQNVLDYRVRAYDLADRRLLREPVVDRREPGERMEGYSVARVWSSDRTTAYTLYSEGTHKGFIHALHTDSRSADCIDLPGWVMGRNPAGIDLTADGKLVVLKPVGTRIATVDPVTRKVSPWKPAPAPPAGEPPVRGGGHGLPVLPALAVIGVIGLALIGAAVTVRRRPTAG
jgi:hypothetical protein